MRVLLIAGSQRRLYSCPGFDSKSRALMERMAARLPAEWQVDSEDLGNIDRRERIQPCNACVSTSMALCVWPCNCYEAHNSAEPDLMWNLDLYARLQQADAWAFIGPVNWYGPTSNLKLMFDRLVCMNGGNPREELINHKDPELAMKLEHSPAWAALSRNHLEGRTAAFFCHGDGGGDELDADGRPRILEHPEWFEPRDEPFADMRDSHAPLVWQCRYGGVEVPDALWRYADIGRGRKYSDNQVQDLAWQREALSQFDAWVDAFRAHVDAKGEVAKAPWNHQARGHRWADLKLRWRGLKLALRPKRSAW
jgi:hypothetical protein